MEQLRAISRFFNPRPYFKRRTSLILRMDNLRAGIRYLLNEAVTLPAVAQRRLRHSQRFSGILAIYSGFMLATHSGPCPKVANFVPEQVANFIPESPANFLRNEWPTCPGIRTTTQPGA